MNNDEIIYFEFKDTQEMIDFIDRFPWLEKIIIKMLNSARASTAKEIINYLEEGTLDREDTIKELKKKYIGVE